VDADAESGAARGVRGKRAVHAVQPEHRRAVPGRLGEQAVHQSAALVAAAGQGLSTTVVVVCHLVGGVLGAPDRYGCDRV